MKVYLNGYTAATIAQFNRETLDIPTQTMNTTSETNSTGGSTQADSHDRSRFTFQEGWFELIRPEWETLTHSLRRKKLHILEVGFL